MPKSTGERWMGVPEAAEYLGVRPRTLYRQIDLGEIPAFRIGSVIRIRKEDMDAFLEAHRRRLAVERAALRHGRVVTDDSAEHATSER